MTFKFNQMKSIINKVKNWLPFATFLIVCLFTLNSIGFAQNDSTAIKNETPAPARVRPVKNTFESIWIIDNQTVMVPIKGTLEMDIQHRFGVVTTGYQDLWGFFAPSNIRLGVNYSPINRLNLGIGITKNNVLWDASAKYAIITQTKGKYPVSVSYYSNVAVSTKKDPDKSLFKHSSDRFSFFNQLIIARKITNKLSLQVSPSISHQNSVNGYYTKIDSSGNDIFKEMKHDHFAIAFGARYKVTSVTSFMINYDQPLTRHATNNPDPNLSFGVEFNTSAHSFQLFVGNYFYLSPQRNNLFNTNSPFSYNDASKTHPDRLVDNPNTTIDESTRVKGGRFLIGFNITRLWNY
jgi:hypothetical protein